MRVSGDSALLHQRTLAAHLAAIRVEPFKVLERNRRLARSQCRAHSYRGQAPIHFNPCMGVKWHGCEMASEQKEAK